MRLAIALIFVFLPTVAVAQPSQGVVTMLLGQATLTRRAPATPQPLHFRDDLFAHDQINTGERSTGASAPRRKSRGHRSGTLGLHDH